jgi:hypothetical protein
LYSFDLEDGAGWQLPNHADQVGATMLSCPADFSKDITMRERNQPEQMAVATLLTRRT